MATLLTEYACVYIFHCRRGLIMGVWNCHVSVGNLMGILIPGIWAHHQW